MSHPNHYDGNTDPVVWVNEYNLIGDSNGWNDEMKRLKLFAYLDGAPKMWFKVSGHQLKWSDLKSGLIQTFSNSCHKMMAMEKIGERKQKPKESFQDYWFGKLQLINSLCPSLKEEDVMTYMVQGLNADLGKRVLGRILIEPCKKLNDLYNLCKIMNDVHERSNWEENKVVLAESPLEDTEREKKRLLAEIRNMTKSVEELKAHVIQNKRDMAYEDVKCYFCEEYGHISRYCPHGEEEAIDNENYV
jgi:hypothetical protein